MQVRWHQNPTFNIQMLWSKWLSRGGGLKTKSEGLICKKNWCKFWLVVVLVFFYSWRGLYRCARWQGQRRQQHSGLQGRRFPLTGHPLRRQRRTGGDKGRDVNPQSEGWPDCAVLFVWWWTRTSPFLASISPIRHAKILLIRNLVWELSVLCV